MKRFFVTLMAIGTIMAIWVLASPAVQAQGPNIDDEVNRIAKTLYCPVCPNTPLDVCSTQACVQWRSMIKEMVQQGKTEQEIRDRFVTLYGQQVLGAPPPQGFNWLAYILPVVGILLGATVAWFTVRQWLLQRSGSPGALAAESPSIPKEYADRIEHDLKEF
jgi:cytochrome c-type biogenesis protein CcmH